MSNLFKFCNETGMDYLLSEWNREKNDHLTPETVTYGSNKKVWWKCSQGHEWQASIHNRTKGRGCPYCSGQKVIAGVNDLATLNPNLSQEWNYVRNSEFEPSNCSAQSSKKVWWICELGHEWRAAVCDRSRGDGCPYCSGKRIIKGFNDLATINPKLASEWDKAKNIDINPDSISPNSHKKAWWICSDCGYEWIAQIKSRNSGAGCPVCISEKMGMKNKAAFLKGESSLAQSNPDIAKEWNYEKNGDLKPTNVVAGSNIKVWWKCEKGHEWQSTVCHRVSAVGCPYCTNFRVMPGFNDLATTYQRLSGD